MKKYVAVSLLIVFALLAIPAASYSENAKPVSFEERYNDHQSLFLLYDINVKVNEDWSYVTKAHKKLKVLKEDGRDLGEIPIYYEDGREEIMDLKAFTITPDNVKHEYSKVQDLKIYAGYPMYDDLMVKVITLPEVTVGSVLEHEFTLTSTGLPVKNAFWYSFYVDSPVPMKELRFSITLPKSLGIQYKEFGLTRKPKIIDGKVNINYSWVVRDIAGSDEREDYLAPPTPESIDECIEFSSIKNWRDISDWYSALIVKNLKITPKIESTVKGVISGKITLKNKVQAILEYIQDDFRYVSMSFGDNALEPHPTDEVFKNKYGDCKDLSLLCMSMLKSAGIDSHIALFNTEYSITDPKYDLPIPALFNHVLVLVKDAEGGDFYIDPLLKGYDICQYPAGYQGAYTFVITADGGKFDKFPIFDEKWNYEATKRNFVIEKDGSALMESEMVWDLDASIEERARTKAMSKKNMDAFYEKLDAYLASGGEMIERRVVGFEQKYGPIKTYVKLKRKDEFPATGGVMVIDINGYDRLTSFVKKDRVKPIFCRWNSMKEETSVYRVPSGYEISYIPPDLHLNGGFFNLDRTYVKEGDGIIVNETFRLKRMELPKEDYDKLKTFFDDLPTKSQQRIIIKTAP